MLGLGRNKEHRILKLMSLADYFSLGNILSGFLALVAMFKGELYYSIGFILLAVFFDYIDGKVARFTGNSSKLGADLDSLSDVVSFGVVPAMFGYVVNSTILQLVASLFVVACGVLRLARFNAIKVDGFIGVPITAFGVLVPIIYLIKIPIISYPVVFIIYGLFMVSSFRIKKFL